MKSEQKISRQRRKWLQAQLMAQLGPSKSSLYRAAFFSWAQFLTRLVSYLLIAQALTQVYQGQALSFWRLALYLLGLNELGYGFGYLAKRDQGVASRYARNQLKETFFRVFLQHQGDFEGGSFADTVTVATQGIDSLDTFYQQYLTTTLRVRLNCVTIWLLLLLLFPMGSLVLLASVPLIPISIVLMQKRSQAIMQHYWSTYMDVGNLFMDDLKGMNTLYSYGGSERYEQDFVAKAEAFRLSTMALLKFQLQAVGYMDGVMYIGISLAGILAAHSLGQGQLSLMTFVLFLLVAAEFFAPIRELGYCMHLLMMNTKMADRIFSFFELAESQASSDQGDGLAQVESIHFQGLAPAYDTKEPLFAPLTAEFTAQAINAIAGESGVGKTTLAKILTKQMPVEPGQVFLNQQDLAHISKEAIQAQVLYVSPHSYVFNGTIWDNLALASDRSRQEVDIWLKDHQLLSFLADLPEGLDTPVGEDGQALSPGQRQQIIVVRALLSQRSVYIFDEMTSSVDIQTEAEIFKAVTVAKETALVIWISHKMRQVQEADSVLFLEAGQATQGKPQVLYEGQASYRTFVDRQKELEELLYGIL